MTDVQKALQAILTAINYQGADRKTIPAPVICISRDLGSGGNEIAVHLAERLKVPLYDREILERIAERLRADPSTVAALDRGVAQWRDMWLFSAFGAGGILVDDYRRQLVNVVIGIARSGGVILGRGAHLILAKSGALRVRLTASVPVCAQRLAAREALSPEEATRRVLESNKARDDFLRQTFHAKADDASAFDLTICTDHIADFTQLTDILVNYMRLVRAPQG